MSALRVECYQCHHRFGVEPDDLRPYHGAYIQGNRPPEYAVRCPACGAKNVMRLSDETLIAGKPPRKR